MQFSVFILLCIAFISCCTRITKAHKNVGRLNATEILAKYPAAAKRNSTSRGSNTPSGYYFNFYSDQTCSATNGNSYANWPIYSGNCIPKEIVIEMNEGGSYLDCFGGSYMMEVVDNEYIFFIPYSDSNCQYYTCNTQVYVIGTQNCYEDSVYFPTSEMYFESFNFNT